ncbi:MAG: hypothetical protein KKB20_12095 [Proteobacteria bacterium]|nr:hypothetical protein [Pseudomonadota bacterium]
MVTESEQAALLVELEALRAELNQLEAALPPHGLKPGHLQRIEELEDLIEAKTELLQTGALGSGDSDAGS